MNLSWYVGATSNLFDLQDRESDDDREVLDTGGCRLKELRRSSQYMKHWKICVDVKSSPRDYGTKEDVTVTESLWCGGSCRQDGLGTTAVLEPKSQVRALGLEED